MWGVRERGERRETEIIKRAFEREREIIKRVFERERKRERER